MKKNRGQKKGTSLLRIPPAEMKDPSATEAKVIDENSPVPLSWLTI